MIQAERDVEATNMHGPLKDVMLGCIQQLIFGTSNVMSTAHDIGYTEDQLSNLFPR